MIASPKLRNTLQRRSAFTLLEVLIVVAILLVLATAATVAVFKYLDNAKEDKARMDMQTFERIYRGEVARSGGELGPANFSLQEHVAPMLENGLAGLRDPWGGQYQSRPYTEERVQFFCITTQGKEIMWPDGRQ